MAVTSARIEFRFQPEEKEPDLSGFGGLTIDAEPDLSPAAADLSRIEPPPEKRHEPPAEAPRRAVGTMYGGAAAEAKPFSPPPVRPHAADEAAPARMIPPDQEGRAAKAPDVRVRQRPRGSHQGSEFIGREGRAVTGSDTRLVEPDDRPQIRLGALVFAGLG